MVTGTALVAAPLLKAEVPTESAADRAVATEFLSKWEQAWNNHDAHQLCLLHTPDANTVNRFGTLVQGRQALEKALGFLHGVGGPFHDVTASPLQIIDWRHIAPNVLIVQASWTSPVMNPDGKLDTTKQDAMIVSYTLLKSSGGDWRAVQVDLHNVDKMDLPFRIPVRSLSPAWRHYAHSAKRNAVLKPFIHWYVQRETAANEREIVEPVLPRTGTMLEFQFASVYEVKAFGSEQLRPSWAATVIGPIASPAFNVRSGSIVRAPAAGWRLLIKSATPTRCT